LIINYLTFFRVNPKKHRVFKRGAAEPCSIFYQRIHTCFKLAW